ncbi:hypothetical protein L7F22_002532 [Adiantum nelumboides]|nr:hypothetical protein [Adiantum nelumboides]
MAEEGAAAFEDYPNKRKHEESEEQERKAAFSPSPGERVRKTGFSGPPGELQPDRKTGFSAPLSEPYDRRSGFSGEQYERKTGISAPNDSERKTGFSATPPGDFERKTGFSSHSGDMDRKSGFSGPSPDRKTSFSGPDFERKSGFSSPPHSDYDRKSSFTGGDTERKTGFSGPSGEQPERKTGFSGPPTESRTGFSNAPSSGLSTLEVAKQRAEQIAARLVAQDNKRPRVHDDGDDQFAGNSGYQHEERDHGQMYQDVEHHREDQGGSYYDMQGQYNSKRMDIPNGRVGVVIGKSGETIKGLQAKSGARIQITRDADHDPQAQNRQVEIMGTPDQIRRAEQMIKDVIAEADAGGPGPFLGGGFGGSGSFGEPIQIRVPTSKVGLIIGRGGETIKSMQHQSGARIQLVPAAMPDYSQERVITLVGTKQQTDMASDLITEVIDENRPRGPPGGYNQQGFRPPGAPQWGQPRPPMQSQGYGYQQGSYPGQSQSQPYGGYGQQQSGGPPQQFPPHSGPYGGYNQQRPPPQQFPSQSQPYGSSQDFSGQPQQYGGFAQRAPAPSQQQQGPQGYFNPSSQQGASPTENSSAYGQPPAPYNQQSPYGHQEYGQQGSAVQSPGQSTPNTQQYGQTFPQQQPYGQTASGQAGFGQQGYSQPGYGPQGVSQPTEQNPSAQAVYSLGSAQPAQQMQPNYGQQPSNQVLGYGQQAPGFTQQEGIPTAYGQGGSFQPGYSMQGGSQQEGSTQPGYNQKDASQVGFGPAGTTQAGYTGGTAQLAYGQVANVQPAYGTQGATQSCYGQQGTPQPGYAQQGPYGAQSSPASVYGTPQQGNAVMYSGQGSVQSGYPVQGSLPAPTSYAQAGNAQPSYIQQGTGVGYSHGVVPPNPSYSEGASPSGKASNGGFDSASMPAGPGGVQNAQS